MTALFLLFALQFQNPAVRATAADSAVARATLRTGLVAFDSISGHTYAQEMSRRYLEQLHLWGMKEEGGNAAFRFDSAVMRTYRTGSTHNTYVWLSQLLHKGDTVSADRFIARMPEVTSDEVIGLVVKDLMHQRPALASRLEAGMTKPWPRAELLRHRALFVVTRTDSAAARAMLQEAINLARTDTVFGTWTIWTWMMELLRLGGQVAIDDIVQAAMVPEGDLWNARFAVADALGENIEPQARAAISDSLVAGIERQEPARRPHSRLRLLQLRGTAADSVLAMALRDSLESLGNPSPELVRQRQRGRQLSELYQSASSLDESQLRAALATPASDTELATFLNHVRTLTTLQVDAYRPTYRDDLSSYTRAVMDLTDPLLRTLNTLFRDSVYVFRAALVSYLNAPEGLAFARSISTPRFRDRAVSEAIVRLVRIDADLAERAAASLQDATARATAYSTLARAAAAGGRLSAAASLAANARGESRLRALYDVASAQLKSGLIDHARRTFTDALPTIDAEPRCDGCIHVVTSQTQPSSIGTEPGLLAETVFLGVLLGMREQLLVWATTQSNNPKRANAHLVVVEAMSRHLLGHSSFRRLR